MALTQITYNDKSDYQASALANEYKVSASDMNEIKSVVNNLVGGTATYSSSEIAVGTWVDNKTIYRKVFTGTLAGGESTQTIAHGISNIDKFIRISGVATTTASQYWVIPIRFSATQYVSVRTSSDNIYFNSTNEFASQPYVLILEYTKTS